MSSFSSHIHIRALISAVALLTSLLGSPSVALSAPVSDPVLDWIGVTNDTVLATSTNPLVTSRVVALVSASVFDAVNGIDRQYQPIHVTPDAPKHASAGAAAVEAAFTILIKLYPTLTPSLTARRDASLTALSSNESARSIGAGTAWGQTVANNIWAWRSTDGSSPPPPPFLGVLGIVGTPAAVGFWRPTPLINAFGAAPQYATMTPWVLARPSQFRLPPPNALTTTAYAADYNESKLMGSMTSSARSADQSELALFWNGNTPLYWNRITAQIAAAQSLSLSQNAHLFALLNIAMADAAIACWDSKYRYVFWRPITAIRSGDLDGNDSTVVDPAWTPWLDFFPTGTPAHPEYPSGHSTVSGAAAAVLTSSFGDNTPFTVTSDVRAGTRSFPSFSAAVAEIADARVFGGIHFRSSCVLGNALGQQVANYVMAHALRRDHADGD